MDKLERARIEGASKSLRKTISDIEAILDGDDPDQATSELREELREVIRDALSVTAREWLDIGFKGGHLRAAHRFVEDGAFPLRLEGTRTDIVPGEGGRVVPIKVSSRLPKHLRSLIRARRATRKRRR